MSERQLGLMLDYSCWKSRGRISMRISSRSWEVIIKCWLKGIEVNIIMIRRGVLPLWSPPQLLCSKCACSREKERGRGPKRRIRVRDRIDRHHLTRRGKSVICLIPFFWDKFSKKGFSKYCNYPVFILSDAGIVCYLWMNWMILHF